MRHKCHICFIYNNFYRDFYEIYKKKYMFVINLTNLNTDLLSVHWLINKQIVEVMLE